MLNPSNCANEKIIKKSALEESERRLRELFEHSRDGLSILDENARLVEANSAFCKMLGYTLDELKQMDGIQTITPPRWQDWEKQEVWEKRLLQKGYSGMYEKELIHKNGSIFPVELQCHAFFDEDGKFQYVWGIVRNITERKKAEKALNHYQKHLKEQVEIRTAELKQEVEVRRQAETALRCSKESYQILTEKSADAIYKINIRTEQFTYISPSIEKLIGYTVEEGLSLTVPDVLTSESDSMQRKQIIKAIETKQMTPQMLELAAIHKDGRVVPVEVHIEFILDADDKPFEILGVARDITKRKQTEMELIENKNYLNVLFNSTLSGIMVIDAETHIITDLNATAIEAIGLPKEKIVGQVCHNFVCPAERGKCPIADLGQIVDRTERVLLNNQGEACTILKTVKPLKIGKRNYLIESFIDISERKAAEERIIELNRLNEQLLISGRLEDKLKLITDRITDIFKTDFTRIWLTKPGDLCNTKCIHAIAGDDSNMCKKRDMCLHLMASSGRYTHLNGSHQRVPYGFYKIGRIASEEVSKYVTNDVVNDPRIGDHAWAKDLELSSFAGYRLMSASGRPMGVLALFSKNKISPEEDALLESIAGSAAHVIQAEMAREALRANEKFLDAIIENIPDMIFVKEAQDLRFARFNKAGENLLGYSREELYGKNDYDFFPEKEADFFVQKDREVLRKGNVLDILEEKIHTRNKGERILHTKKIPILGDDQEPIYLLGISEDITEKRQAQAIQRFQAQIIDQIHDSVISVDMDGMITSWNKGSEALFDYQDHEIIGKHVSSLYPQDVHHRLRDNIIPTLLSKGSHGYETKLIRKGGAGFSALVSLSVLRDADENINGMIGYTLDISEQKKAENELKLREQLLDFAIEQMPLPVIIARAPDVKITKYNKHAINLLAKPIDDLSSMVLNEHREFWPTFYPDGSPYDPDDLPLTRAIKKGEVSKDIEIIIRKEDKDYWVSASAAPLYNDDGDIIAGIVVFPDITDQKIARKKLADSERRLADIIDFLPDPTFAIDNVGRIITWNRAIEKLTGIKRNEMIGKGDYAYALPFYGERRPGLADLLLKRDKRWEKKYLMLKEDNGIPVESKAYHPIMGENGRYLSATAARLYNSNGEVVGVIESLRDITDAKQAEEEREKLIKELQDAIAKVQTLSGLLPICASCKKIRDDQGYWNHVETYISEHSKAEFSHSICPGCAEALYPELEVYRKSE